METFSNNAAEKRQPFTERPDRLQYIDIHCHCLASIDDGPATTEESLALCRALVDDGISTVIATPHQLGRFSGSNEASLVRESVGVLNEALRTEDIPLTAAPGGDVRVDERICQLLEADEILTLADGGRYILLELPHEIFIDIEPLLIGLASMGVRGIISHPERHRVLAQHPDKLLKLVAAGACLQVTAASLLGEFGSQVKKAAWHFLVSGWVSFVATDAHDLFGRRPLMRPAFECISERLGEAIARLVCIENPLRILEGREIQTAGLSQWKRINERVRSSY